MDSSFTDTCVMFLVVHFSRLYTLEYITVAQIVCEMFPKGSKMKGSCNVASILSVNLLHFSFYKRIRDKCY